VHREADLGVLLRSTAVLLPHSLLIASLKALVDHLVTPRSR